MLNLSFDMEFDSHRGGIGRDSREILSIFNNLSGVSVEELNLDSRSNKSKAGKIWNRLFAIHIDTSAVVHFSPQIGCKIPRFKSGGVWIVRVHDLFPISNPEWFPWISVILFRNAFKKMMKRKPILCVNSISTKNQLLKMIPNYDPTAIFYLPCSAGPIFSTSPCMNCSGCSMTRIELPYGIAVGTIEPRKNYSELINAFANSRDGKLVIVGSKGWKQKKLQENLRQINPRVIWVESPCDASLSSLYRSAKFYISNSHDEGFEIPAIEARIFRLPLILSDIPVHREIHTGQAIFFKADELDHLATKVFSLNLQPSEQWSRPPFEQFLLQFLHEKIRNG
jgi:glycosyltransferase involved in cell wall biosynthesis